MKRLTVPVTLTYPDQLSNAEVRKELLDAEVRANEGMKIRLHFECPDDIKHDDPDRT
jgi:hypothetical protein